MARRSPHRQSQRDQIAAALRSEGTGALSTDQVAQDLAEVATSGLYSEEPCRRPMGYEVYPLLRSLEAEGLAQRVYVEGDRRVFWRWTGPADADVLAVLEEAWAL